MRRKLCTRNIDELGGCSSDGGSDCIGNETDAKPDIYLEDDSVVISKSTDKPSCIMRQEQYYACRIDNNLLCWGCISKIKEL